MIGSLKVEKILKLLKDKKIGRQGNVAFRNVISLLFLEHVNLDNDYFKTI